MPLAGLLIMATIAVLAKAGVVMLLFGALHSHVPAVPALGFWVSLIIVALYSPPDPDNERPYGQVVIRWA